MQRKKIYLKIIELDNLIRYEVGSAGGVLDSYFKSVEKRDLKKRRELLNEVKKF